MKILFTIDVEIGDRHMFKDVFRLMVEEGTSIITKLLSKREFVGHFFVDLYPNAFYGNRFDQIIHNITTSNSHAYLHAHPAGKFDRKRCNMYEYSEEEQDEILDFGINEWKRITGVFPIGFRAGSYSANDTTLMLLKKKGFSFDSSYFKGNKRCKIKNPGILKQIPINHVHSEYRFFGFRKIKMTKFDINLMPVETIKKYIEKYKNDKGYIMIFLHSFSFANTITKKQRKSKVKDFENLLDFIKEERIKCVTNITSENLQPIEIKKRLIIPLKLKDIINYFIFKQI